MSQLFVSFSYSGSLNENSYDGFANMTIDEPALSDLDNYTFIEYLTMEAEKDCSNYYDNSHAVILFWKKL